MNVHILQKMGITIKKRTVCIQHYWMYQVLMYQDSVQPLVVGNVDNPAIGNAASS